MHFLDKNKIFAIKIYPDANTHEFHSLSNELPVFHQAPAHPVYATFGLCVSNETDVQNAQACFAKNPQNESCQNFLYILGDACRQTDTLKAASLTNYPLIIEKGPFLSPDDVKRMVAKLTHDNFAIVECGSSFGYANRVLDPRSLHAIKKISPFFGVCLTDLIELSDETYPYKPEWLQTEDFTEAFQLSIKNFNPNFYVYKMGKEAKKQSEYRSSLQSNASAPYANNWNGTICDSVQLSRNKLTVIAGPCMLETLELGLAVGTFLKGICENLGFQYIFKSSFDKANRTSVSGTRGPGIKQGVEWLKHIKNTLNVPIITDVHSAEQVDLLSEVVDVLQIPAFLFRDQHLLLACAKTNKPIQIKKGQWASAQDMLNVAHFLSEHNFHKVILAERGSCFGYNNLVVDFRNIIDMASQNHAVVFDATHAVQLPGAKNGKSSGLRNMVPALTKAAFAIGIDGLFMEVHPQPEKALSDSDTQLSFEMAAEILKNLSIRILA